MPLKLTHSFIPILLLLLSDADIVCARAKNHFDPSVGVDLSDTDPTQSEAGKKQSTRDLAYYQKNFKPLAATAQRRMYFT
jgi:eukaryotic translation initiation factor 2C